MASAGIPAPGSGLQAAFLAWPADREFHRIHDANYAPAQYNATDKGNARFSPIKTAKGKVIPTLYGGDTFDCAAMETAFHDIPYTPGLKTFDKDKLCGKCASVIRPARDLQLIDLSNTALRKLGITRAQLIDTDAADYVLTRPWAEALHGQFPKADGLTWVSRQDDRARALVLFGDRIGKSGLAVAAGPTVIVGDPGLYGQLLALAQRIGVDIIA